MTEVRAFSPIPTDLALVRRLAPQLLLMDATTALTRDVNPLEAALLSMVPLADLGLPTLILRENDQAYIGQLRHRSGERCAHLACVAPIPQIHHAPLVWLHLIEGLISAAGRRGAFMIMAEVNENAYPTIEILRKAGFMVYYRQTIYRRLPNPIEGETHLRRFCLRPAQEMDWHRLQNLYANLVPSLVQQVTPFPEDSQTGLVIESLHDGRLMGFLERIEGKTGILVRPTLHPDTYDQARAIFEQALVLWNKYATKLPIYFSVRSYHEWLGRPLIELGMEEGERQVVFVKHIVARVDPEAELVRGGRDVMFNTLVGSWEIRLDSDQQVCIDNKEAIWNIESQTT